MYAIVSFQTLNSLLHNNTFYSRAKQEWQWRNILFTTVK